MTQASNPQKRYAAIHIQAAKAGLKGASYRNFLLETAGVTSCKALTDEQFNQVMDALSSRIRERTAPGRTKTPTEAKIWALWYAIKPYLLQEERSIPYLLGIVSRIAKRKLYSVSMLGELDGREAYKVIEGLKNRLAQEEAQFSRMNDIPF